MAFTAQDVKTLREKTGAAIMDCKKALEEADGNMKKAEELVQARGLAKAEKKADRETKEGFIGTYVHTNGKIGVMVELLCETDFVGRNEEFQKLAREIALHLATSEAKDVEELLKEEYIRDPGYTIEALVKQLSGKIGEKLVVNRFVRFMVGE
ncbi:MAG: elongation factor Ts [Patescibacteria group bacterium]|nr:elongation factor Ts [Patescibacteria group bacterium]